MPRSAGLTAEGLAELCLGHLAQDPELLADFMGTTGYSPAGPCVIVGTYHNIFDYSSVY